MDAVSGIPTGGRASWGSHSVRARQNLLSGTTETSDGDRCRAEFLLFDTKKKQLNLCRYSENSSSLCSVKQVKFVPADAALQNPRLLQLCPRLRIFASLDFQIPQGSVLTIWQLGRKTFSLDVSSPSEDSANGEPCVTASKLCPVDIDSARFFAWLDAEVPPWFLEDGDDLNPVVTGTCGSTALAVLAMREVIIVVLGHDQSGTMTVKRQIKHSIGFQAVSLAWSACGSQIFVGGAGQMACVMWSKNNAPRTRHMLCAGDCTDIMAVHGCAFICRIEQKPEPENGSEHLMLPTGQRVMPPCSRQGLVVEVENPQDDCGPPPGMDRPLIGSVLNSLGAGSVSTFLQVVPCRRYLLPLRCEVVPSTSVLSADTENAATVQSGTNDPSWRLKCGVELEVPGDFAIARSDFHGLAVAVAGSYDGNSVKAWSLMPPHRWGRSSGQTRSTIKGCWSELVGPDLFGNSAEICPIARKNLRVHGLTLLQGTRGLELHGILVRTEASIFDRSASAPKELIHCSGLVQMPPPKSPEHSSPSAACEVANQVVFAELASSDRAPTRAFADRHNLAKLSEDVAGIRSELRLFRESFDGFRSDFSRLADALETIVKPLTELAAGGSSDSSA